MLPNELWEEVFTYCDLSTKYQLLTVNRFFYHVFHNQEFIPTHPRNIKRLKDLLRFRLVYPIDWCTWAMDIEFPNTSDGTRPVRRIVKCFSSPLHRPTSLLLTYIYCRGRDIYDWDDDIYAFDSNGTLRLRKRVPQREINESIHENINELNSIVVMSRLYNFVKGIIWKLVEPFFEE